MTTTKKPRSSASTDTAQAPDLVDSDGRPLPALPEGPPKIDKASSSIVIIMAVVAVVGVALVLWAWQLGPFRTTMVTTENSYVRGQMTVLAPQVNGYVAKVLVRDYQRVKTGDVLVQIDDRTYRQQLDQARGQLAAAQANLSNVTQTAEQNLAEIEARQYRCASAIKYAQVHVRQWQTLPRRVRQYVSLRNRPRRPMFHEKASKRRSGRPKRR
jgi:multidrug resistance efflux pump